MKKALQTWKPLPMKAFYTVRELCDACKGGMSYKRMRTMLQTCGVEYQRSGKNLLVPLSEISEKVPLLWESILQLNEQRRPNLSDS